MAATERRFRYTCYGSQDQTIPRDVTPPAPEVESVRDKTSDICKQDFNVEPICPLRKADKKMALCTPQVFKENTRRDKLHNYYCDLCYTSCTTADKLAQHLLGNKHKRYLHSIRPQERNDAIRLSSFMKAHMKEEPIVGLEYIMEKKKDSLYTYTCQLCGLPICHLPAIVAHLIDPSHTECYIKKHFLYLFSQFNKTSNKCDYIKSLRNAAVMILELQGNKKETQAVLPESDGNTRKASEDTPPSKLESDSKMREASEDTPPSKPESDSKMREASEDTPPSKPESDIKMRVASEDTPPSKLESDIKMRIASEDTSPSKSESDSKMREASEDTPPSKPESDIKMRVASEDTPPSKLESDGKMREASEDTPPSNLESDSKIRVASEDTPPSKPESDSKMREASEDTPPSNLESDSKMRVAIKDPPPSKPESDCKTREASEDAPPSKPESDSKTSGAFKDTPPSKPESDGKTSGASKDTPPSKPESGNRSHSKWRPLPYQETGLDESHESYRYNKMLQKSNSNDPPLAKRSRPSPGGDRDALPSTAHISKHGSSHHNKSHAIRMDCTAAQELEFKTNDEFFEYFANFVISDDEDVVFIRTITQNCIKALTHFQEEDAEREKTGHQPEAPLEDTSRTARKISVILEDETKSHLSNSETSLLKDNLKPLSDSIPKNKATDLFFDSIKDMNESEVVGIFQKIAAMNPEYQEMNIPSVIRFLKYSGKLKKS